LTKDDIDSKIEKISEHMNSPDVEFQGAALDAFIELISNNILTTTQKQKLLPEIEKMLKDTDSSLRTECFKIVCLIGSKEFDLIKEIFPIIFQELEKKNRFRSEIITDMICTLRNSNNPLIQDSIKKLIKHIPEWFDESFLVPIIVRFWSKSTDYDFQFIEKYLKEIQNEIPNYPVKIRELIFQKLKDYDNHLKKIQDQKIQEAKIREEQEKRRKELLREAEELKKKREIEKLDMKNKLEEYIKSIPSNKEVIAGNTSQDSNITKNDARTDNKSIELNAEVLNPNHSHELKENESKEFTTFTSLGLKRKILKKNQ